MSTSKTNQSTNKNRRPTGLIASRTAREKNTNAKNSPSKRSFNKKMNSNKINSFKPVAATASSQTSRSGSPTGQPSTDPPRKKRSRNENGPTPLNESKKDKKKRKKAAKQKRAFERKEAENSKRAKTIFNTMLPPKPDYADAAVTEEALRDFIANVIKQKRHVHRNDKNRGKKAYLVVRGSLRLYVPGQRRQAQWICMIITGPDAYEIALEMVCEVGNSHWISKPDPAGIKLLTSHQEQLLLDTEGNPNNTSGRTVEEGHLYDARK